MWVFVAGLKQVVSWRSLRQVLEKLFLLDSILLFSLVDFEDTLSQIL